MSHRPANPHVVRLSLRVFVVGLWAVITGLTVLVLAFRGMTGLSADRTTTAFLSAVGLGQVVVDGLYLVYSGGLLAFVVGGVTLGAGGVLLLSVRH